jgi:hypothetical protein
MEAKLIEELIEKNKPFRIETASGRVFNVPHRDFIAWRSHMRGGFEAYKWWLLVQDRHDPEHLRIENPRPRFSKSKPAE